VTSARRASKPSSPHDSTSVQTRANDPPGGSSRDARSTPLSGSTQCHALNAAIRSVLSVGGPVLKPTFYKSTLMPNFSRAMDNIVGDVSIATTLRPWLIREPVAMLVRVPISIVGPGFQSTQFDDVLEHFIGIAGSIAVVGNGGSTELQGPLS